MCRAFPHGVNVASQVSIPRAPRRGRFAPLADRAAYYEALSHAASETGCVIVRVVTTPRMYPNGASCAVLFADGTYQRAWFHGAIPRSGRVYVVWGAFGPGPFERRRTTFWIGEPAISGILRGIPTWAWEAEFPGLDNLPDTEATST